MSCDCNGMHGQNCTRSPCPCCGRGAPRRRISGATLLAMMGLLAMAEPAARRHDEDAPAAGPGCDQFIRRSADFRPGRVQDPDTRTIDRITASPRPSWLSEQKIAAAKAKRERRAARKAERA